MKQRNSKSHRLTEANQRKTELRIEQYHGKIALLNTWEKQPDGVQADNHDYILKLRRQIRNVKNYLLHRAGTDSDL